MHRNGEIEARNRKLGEHIMNKILLPVFIALVLSWSCTLTLAKAKDAPKSRSVKTYSADTNDPQLREKVLTAKRKKRDRDLSRKARAERMKAHEKRLLERQKNRVPREIDEKTAKTIKGGNREQQLKALETQIASEQAKHRKRVARLKKIQELATQTGNEKIITRVKKLKEKEQKRYDRKHGRMDLRKRMLIRRQEGTRPDRRPGRKGANREKSEMSKEAYLEMTKAKAANKDKTKTNKP
jgi:hypothetical protein